MNQKDKEYLNDVFGDNPVGMRRVMGMIEQKNDDIITYYIIRIAFVVLSIGFGIMIGRGL